MPAEAELPAAWRANLTLLEARIAPLSSHKPLSGMAFSAEFPKIFQIIGGGWGSKWLTQESDLAQKGVSWSVSDLRHPFQFLCPIH